MCIFRPNIKTKVTLADFFTGTWVQDFSSSSILSIKCASTTYNVYEPV